MNWQKLYVRLVQPITIVVDFILAFYRLWASYSFDIQTLQKWLNNNLSFSALFFISFMFIASLYVLAGFVLLSLPLLIGTLVKERRYGWLVSLFLFIIFPAIFILMHPYSSTWFYILKFIPVAFFLFYCFLLKHSLPRWQDPLVEPNHQPDLDL